MWRWCRYTLAMVRLFAVFCTVALVSMASTAPDTIGPPYNYVRPTKGGRYVFVMLAPKPYRDDDTFDLYLDAVSNERKSKAGKLSKKYRSSGLYPKGSTMPLWTVDWYVSGVIPCSDGVHLVALGAAAAQGDEGKSGAVGFYRSGKLVRRYLVRDLVPNYEDMPTSTSLYFWLRSSGFDDAGKRLRIEVYKGKSHKPGNTFYFDIRTGKQIQSRKKSLPHGRR